MRYTLSMIFIVVLLLFMPYDGFAVQFKTPGQSLVPGTISIGKHPSYIDPDKPAIVFVQGLTNNSTVWYVGNDMYDRALQAGYQTAFVELNDSGGTPKSYWENGAMLAEQLEEISAHFGGKKLVIVAFSKGGVDTQVALIHENKYPLVSNVITLSSPHYGSELADLANSMSLGWLTGLIGRNSEGTKSLQTGVMNYFRSITDNRYEASQNRYFTLSGTRNAPISSSYWFGSNFISGPNDGVVSVASSQLPYSTTLAIGDWNHSEINKGYNTFSIFQPYLTTQKAAVSSGVMEPRRVKSKPLDSLVRGGKQKGKASESFYVEREAEHLVINWMSATPHDRVTIKSPDGSDREYRVTAVEDHTLFFEGAYHHTIDISEPAAGKWTAETVTDEESAYALMVTFDSSLNEQLVLEDVDNKKNWMLNTNFEVRSKAKRHADIDMSTEISFTPGDGREDQRQGQQRNFKQSGKAVNLPSEEGTYHMTVEVEGTTPSGQKFQRTVVETIFIDDEGMAY
ncbi:esterase/lipase family protein [Jeotgalibacillus salarius]|uniref:Triacylglycerol lipase n=1 Tax=Jeotgalibacillus salarius TaxID=546023 RepID=A0A4Y8LFR1_9BACL|nr:hypothetical protein [Jeotgalibacillus salarius]TFE01612.1 hypothetical protein E2626_08560 [Jeotgalibacillus salarius]